MIFHRIKSEGTANNSYLIGSTNQNIANDLQDDLTHYCWCRRLDGSRIFDYEKNMEEEEEIWKREKE
jgi:hypothetical protein